jgi:hypothetical protein
MPGTMDDAGLSVAVVAGNIVLTVVVGDVGVVVGVGEQLAGELHVVAVVPLVVSRAEVLLAVLAVVSLGEAVVRR